MATKRPQKLENVLTSKTARKSAEKGKSKEQGFLASGEMDRIRTYDNANWVDVLDPRDGRTYKFKVASPTWVGYLRGLLESTHGARIRNELDKLYESGKLNNVESEF
jgi:hypothetical protein